jgi:hypothetical protein
MSNPLTKGKLARPAFEIRPQLTVEEVQYLDALAMAAEKIRKMIRQLNTAIRAERRRK